MVEALWHFQNLVERVGGDTMVALYFVAVVGVGAVRMATSLVVQGDAGREYVADTG